MRNDRSIRKNTRSTNTKDSQVVTTQQKKETIIRETVDTERTPQVILFIKETMFIRYYFCNLYYIVNEIN